MSKRSQRPSHLKGVPPRPIPEPPPRPGSDAASPAPAPKPPGPVTLAEIAKRHPGDFAAQAAEVREALAILANEEQAAMARLDAIRSHGKGLAGALEALEAQG